MKKITALGIAGLVALSTTACSKNKEVPLRDYEANGVTEMVCQGYRNIGSRAATLFFHPKHKDDRSFFSDSPYAVRIYNEVEVNGIRYNVKDIHDLFDESTGVNLMGKKMTVRADTDGYGDKSRTQITYKK